jgi:signal transduction histidine kinase
MTLLKWTANRYWLVTGFGLLTVLIGMSGVVSYQNTTQLVESTKKSQKTNEVIRDLNDLSALITLAESGRRGFIYMDNRQELKRYQDAVSHIPSKLQDLRLQMDSQSHLYDSQKHDSQKHGSQKLDELTRLVTQRLELFQQSIELYRPDKPEIISQEIITMRSLALRDRIQQIIEELQQQQQEQLTLSVVALQTSIQNRRVIEFWLVFSGFVIVLLCFLALHHQLKQQQQTEMLQQRFAQEKELSDLKLRFFSMVSHEFRTPLSIILGSAQMLTSSHRTWSDDRTLKNLRRIQSSAKVMTQLLNDILTLTRAEAGKLECKPETLDLEAFCLNLIEDFQALESVNHSLIFLSDGQVTHADLDERLLYSTLSNLISNAIKYSPANSTVQLRLSRISDSVIFQIHDEGAGIALEDQPSLFEPFYRGQNATAIAGTGLGLAVVKKCVDLQGGTIEVESENGKGTTFTVTVPQKGMTETKDD